MMVSRRLRRWGRMTLAAGVVIGSLVGMGKAADAQLIADDNFSYSAGLLNGVGNGFGWYPVATDAGAAKWNGDANTTKVSTPGLIYTDFGALGNTATTGGRGKGAYRSLAVNQGSVNGTNTVYVSFLARKNPSDATPLGPGSATYAGISLFNGFTFGSQERFFMGMPYESATWGFEYSGVGVQRSTIAVDATLHLFVYRFDFTTSNADIRLYVDPLPAAEPAIPTLQLLGSGGFNFQQVRIESGNPDLVPNIDFDELKIAHDYATAVGVSLSGRVVNFGGNPNPNGISLMATFKNPATNAVVFTRTATLDADGNFGFTAIPRGTYNVVYSGRKVLGLAADNVVLATAASDQSLTFFGGDANGDNFTDISDLLILIGAYNSTSTGANYKENADFNNDGANDISDLLILINAYNKQGAM